MTTSALNVFGLDWNPAADLAQALVGAVNGGR